MPHAPKAVALAFEDFLKELPAESAAMAQAFKAFARPRKRKTPAQRRQVVMLSCGLDQAWRTTAGSVTPDHRDRDPAALAGLRIVSESVAAHDVTRPEEHVDVVAVADRRWLIAARTGRGGNGRSGAFGAGFHPHDRARGDRGRWRGNPDSWQAGDIALVDRGDHQPPVTLG